VSRFGDACSFGEKDCGPASRSQAVELRGSHRILATAWGFDSSEQITESQNSRGWKGPLWVI